MTAWMKTNPESLQEFYYLYEIVTTKVDAVAHRDAKDPRSRGAPNDLGMLTAIDIRRRKIMGSHCNIANSSCMLLDRVSEISIRNCHQK